MIYELPSTERIREILSYDQNTGDVRWRTHATRKNLIGEPAGTVVDKNHPYLQIYIDGKEYRAIYLLWKYVTGLNPPDLSFKDGNSWNMRFDNIVPSNRRKAS